jgi:hypothetical protein
VQPVGFERLPGLNCAAFVAVIVEDVFLFEVNAVPSLSELFVT